MLATMPEIVSQRIFLPKTHVSSVAPNFLVFSYSWISSHTADSDFNKSHTELIIPNLTDCIDQIDKIINIQYFLSFPFLY